MDLVCTHTHFVISNYAVATLHAFSFLSIDKNGIYLHTWNS
jgi:hypothetical protein